MIFIREMLTSALRALVKNPVKESFYRKRKKKAIDVLIVFSFPIKVILKFSLNGFLTSVLRKLVSMTYL